MPSYAAGKNAFGFCDRCGFRYKLSELRSEVVNLFETNLKVCKECFDPDHPQNQLGRISDSDPQALRNPRPVGAIDGRFDTANRWDFDTGTDYWVPNPASGSSLTWNSSEKNVTLSYTEEENDPGIQITETVVGSAAIDVDASEYAYVKCLVRVSEFPNPFPDTWSGSCFWSRTEDGSSYFTHSSKVEMPNFYEMGDRWHLLTWDLTEDSNWSGTVIRLRFDLFRRGTTFETGILDFDYISVDKE